jgi:arylsulfatase A-like enzyme
MKAIFINTILFFLIAFPIQLKAKDTERPNVLFIAVDDLRPELGCYKDTQAKTPHIDRLAGHGIVFERAYCQVAVCGASRASLLTGLRPTPDRFLTFLSRADEDAPEAITLPEKFKNSDYYTLSNGKIFHHNDDAAGRSWSEEPWRPEMRGRDFIDPESKKYTLSKRNKGPFYEMPDVADNAYPDGQIADKTIDDLKRMKELGKPFFIACGFLKPHLPFYAPKKYWDMYDHDNITLADNQYQPENAPGALKGSSEMKNQYHDRNIEYNSEEWHRSGRHGYYACVSYIDAQIGKIMNALDELGLSENTYIILWGDHGWHLGEHNFWGKHNVMHLATHAPLIFSGPGIQGGQKSKALVEFVDIYPTLIELAGIEMDKKALQGISFKPLLSKPDTPWKQAAFSKYGSALSVITERYNYCEYTNGERMLYDLGKDPDENVNVVDNIDYQEVVEQLSALLKSGW